MEENEKQKVIRIKHDSFEQGSGSWHQFRQKRIGGSDAPIISGQSPWKSSLNLWAEKCGSIEQPDLSQNFAVQRGVRLEPIVRGMVSIMLDMNFDPAVFTHTEKEYLSASLDGWDEENQAMIEIKVGNAPDHKKCNPEDPKSIPKKYFAQIQHQLYVVKPKRAFYCSYWIEKGKDEDRGDLKIVEVFPDEEFISRYLPIAEEFYQCVINNTPPRAVKLEL